MPPLVQPATTSSPRNIPLARRLLDADKADSGFGVVLRNASERGQEPAISHPADRPRAAKEAEKKTTARSSRAAKGRKADIKGAGKPRPSSDSGDEAVETVAARPDQKPADSPTDLADDSSQAKTPEEAKPTTVAQDDPAADATMQCQAAQSQPTQAQPAAVQAGQSAPQKSDDSRKPVAPAVASVNPLAKDQSAAAIPEAPNAAVTDPDAAVPPAIAAAIASQDADPAVARQSADKPPVDAALPRHAQSAPAATTASSPVVSPLADDAGAGQQKSPQQQQAQPESLAQLADQLVPVADDGDKPAAASVSRNDWGVQSFQTVLDLKAPQPSGHTTAAAPIPNPPPTDAQFVENNHVSILTSIHGQLLPHGGSMQIRLDPPELGALQVSVQMRDGVMSASFETTNDQATRLLSHSLDQLRQALEVQGVSVEKLQVQQSPRHQDLGSQGDDRRQNSPEEQAGQQEQQRRDLLRRMWQRLATGSDPLDLMV